MTIQMFDIAPKLSVKSDNSNKTAIRSQENKNFCQTLKLEKIWKKY